MAKEKGFDEPVIAQFESDMRLRFSASIAGIAMNSTGFVAAPLYSQLVDWMRDVHHLHFYIVPYGDGRSWSIVNIGYTDRADSTRLIMASRKKYERVKFETYYAALEEALKEAFKMI